MIAGGGEREANGATSELEIVAGQVVVEVGCGSGADLRALAEAVAHEGGVVGIDIDEEAIGQARRTKPFFASGSMFVCHTLTTG